MRIISRNITLKILKRKKKISVGDFQEIFHIWYCLLMRRRLTANIGKKKEENPLADKADLPILVVQIPLYATFSAAGGPEVRSNIKRIQKV